MSALETLPMPLTTENGTPVWVLEIPTGEYLFFSYTGARSISHPLQHDAVVLVGPQCERHTVHELGSALMAHDALTRAA